MKTTINNNYSIFVITTSLLNAHVGNLENLNEIVKYYNLREGYFTIHRIFNGKMKKVGKAALKALYEANQLRMEFNY